MGEKESYNFSIFSRKHGVPPGNGYNGIRVSKAAILISKKVNAKKYARLLYDKNALVIAILFSDDVPKEKLYEGGWRTVQISHKGKTSFIGCKFSDVMPLGRYLYESEDEEHGIIFKKNV